MAERQQRQVFENSSLDHETENSIRYAEGMSSPAVPLDVTLIQQESVRVYYHRYQGAFGPPLGRFWRDTVYPWMSRTGLTGQRRYGVALDDPMFTDEAKCRYDACVEVGAVPLLDETANVMNLPGGKCASVRFCGTSQEIVKTWDELLRSWLPASGFQLDARPFMERYEPGHRVDEKTGTFECDILIPVTRLL